MSTTSNRFESSADPDAEANQTAAGSAEPNAGLGPTGDASGAAAGTREAAKGPRAAHQQPSIRWVWNLPLLLGTLAVFGVGIPVFVGLYYWQSSRIGGQLLQLADHASAEGDPHEEVQWLRRYLALQPDDVDVQIRIALTFDEHVQQWSQIDQSRRNLIRALTAVEDQGDAVEGELRQRLIERMLQLGGGWLVEAERQIIKLNPPPMDSQALAQMARSLVGQMDSQVPRSVPSDVPEREVDFWRWLAAQPVGDVLRLAVAANPDAVDLANAFLGAALTKPELFTANVGDTPDLVGDTQDLGEQINQVIERLSQQNDNGHAQWTAYFYARQNDVNVPAQPLAVAASAALQRLQEHAASFVAREEGQAPLLIQHPGAYAPLWDGLLVLEHAANLARGQAFDAAKDFYQSLAALPKGMLPPTQAERSYLGLGQSYWQSGNQDAAREAWSEGNAQLGGANLVLLESLATSSIQLDSVEDARRNLEQYAEAIKTASLRLANQGRRMSPAHRDEFQASLNNATWRIDVFRAHLDFRAGHFLRAAQRLERSVASQLNIDRTARIEASELLAEAYCEQGLWDLAGRAFDAAAVLDPSNRLLRQRAAAAWQTASAATRAAEQWQQADDGSYASALAYAGAVAASISAKVPAQRDYHPLVIAINSAQERIDQMTAAGHQPPADAWRLEMLKLSLPAAMRADLPANVESPTADLQSDADVVAIETKLHELLELSQQYPHAAQLQAMTALAAQRAGETKAAEEAYQRLRSIRGVDPVLTAEIQARMTVERGAVDEAVALLRNACDADVDNRLRLTKFAAAFLRAISRPADAIELLMKLDADEQDPQSLLQLGELLLASQQRPSSGESRLVEALPAGVDAAAELQRVEQTIRRLEGDEGTHWRLLAAERLLQSNDGDSARRRQQLIQAAAIGSEILSRRPRWSRALALSGRIAAEQGNARNAVDAVRRAIAEGDKEVTTVLLLVRQLNQLGDVAAAEQELERLKNWTDSVGEISVLAVGVALAQGKYQTALERARAGVAARPSDAAAHVVLAQAAAASARSDAEHADEHRAEADQALRQAQQLTRGRDIGVWQTQLRFQTEIGGRAAGRKVLDAMQQSALPENVRSLALANGYLNLGDWDQARDWFVKARQASPADANVALAQANLFRATKDNEALLEALEDAHRLAPSRQDIRRQLAVALASQTSDEDSWNRIRDLVGADSPDATAADRLYHALLLISRNDRHLIEQAREMLAEMVLSSDPVVADDAARLMLAIERSRWEFAIAGENVDEATAALEASQKLYEQLVRRSQPNPVDIYGYGELLLRVDRIGEAQAMADKLNSIAPASRGALDLQLRLAKETSKEGEFPAIIERWVKRQDGGKSPEAYATVGQVMISLNLTNQAVEVLRAAYETDPAQLRNYVVALAQASQHDRAVAVCIEHFEQARSPEPVALLADVIVGGKRPDLVDERVDELFAAAVKEFSTHLKLLEAIGTLRLSQQRYSDAAQLFSQSEKLSSISLVTLNNMAVALAEIPGRHAEALERIERAIDLYGRDPELLDTLGTVLSRAGQLDAAETALREAYANSSEPRHLLHLVLILDASGKTVEVQKLLSQLDLARVDTSVLSPKDQKQLNSLQQRLGQNAL